MMEHSHLHARVFCHMHEDCHFAKLPAKHPDFWKAKLEGNVA